jgi:hypothetical protein
VFERDSMGFSNRELKAIGEVQRLLHGHRRGWIGLGELPSAVIHEIAMADASRIAPHCMALLPEGSRPHVEACVNRLASSDFRDDLVLYVGPGLSEEKKAWLRPRYRAIAEEIKEYYRQIEGRDEPLESLAVPEVDRFWETLREMRSEDGPKCRREGCDEPTVRVSVYCARHHYENIEKRSPPDY